MEISGLVKNIINRAYSEAKARNHEYLTPEHLLYVSLEFEEIQTILKACGADLQHLRDGMENFFEEKIPVIAGIDPIQTVNFQSVIERAVLSSQASQKRILDAADIIVSLYDEDRNYCAYYLRQVEKIKRFDLLSFISHGNGDSRSSASTGSRHLVDEGEDGAEENHEAAHKNKAAKKTAKTPKDIAAALLLEYYEAADLRKILEVNRFDDVTWFNKEAFEEALFLFPLFISLEGKQTPAKIKTLASVTEAFRLAERTSDYKLEELFAALTQ